MRFAFFLVPCLIAAAVWAQPTTNVAPAKRALQVDSKAVALLDKTAKYYGSLRSLKIVTRGVATWQGDTSPIRLTLFFERPNRVRAGRG